MQNDQELIVITKTYDLILWSCRHTSRFPRNHRFVLGERIERVRSQKAVTRKASAVKLFHQAQAEQHR